MKLTVKEKAALAMHELMKRDQEKLGERIDEQRRISSLSDEELQRLVQAMPVAAIDAQLNKEETDGDAPTHSEPSKP